MPLVFSRVSHLTAQNTRSSSAPSFPAAVLGFAPRLALYTHRLICRKRLETAEQMFRALRPGSSFFSILSLEIPTALASSTLSPQLGQAAGLCAGSSSLL